jgi:pimeloyl-ACP methyl ester carboxylesterase
MKRKILKFLKISCYLIAILFVLLSILPYLLPVNQFKVDFKNPPFTESKFIKIDGRLWHYRKFEPIDSIKGTMVLIHGFSGSTFSWRKNQEVFADSGYRVISIDLPSFGFSEKDRNSFDHSSSAHAANIWKLLDSIGLSNEKIIVFGHSMGAGVAWDLAGLNPGRTAHVFLVDGAGSFGTNSKRSLGATFMAFICKYPPLLRWVDVIAGAYYFKQDKFVDLLGSAYGQNVDKEAAAGYLRPFMLKNSGRAVIEGFLYSKKGPDIDYRKINCPVHLIWGTKDKWVPISVGESFIKKFPQSKLKKFEGAGHCPMETLPQEFNNFVLKNLSKKITTE